MITVYAWPDGTWCFPNELNAMTHKSDDYLAIVISDDLNSSEIDELIFYKVNGRNCPTCEE